MKLSKTQCVTARDGHAFHKHVINIWNALPECVVSANSQSINQSLLITKDRVATYTVM